jgi:hypothetical protein
MELLSAVEIVLLGAVYAVLFVLLVARRRLC